ncbi:MAG TPA: hypothetical protein VHF88_05915 [Thermoleophilaceae bacterium]|nr:hypothetical protein [Thermoleophilaceae bacterium]
MTILDRIRISARDRTFDSRDDLTMRHSSKLELRATASRVAGLAVTGLIASALAAGPAQAAFGDQFGIAPVNDGAGPAQEAPAYPSAHAFWAGACNLAGAPAPGNPPTPIDGGTGGIPATIPAPNGSSSPMAQIPAPATPPHCIDFGQPSPATSDPWDVPPSWRLAPATQAGAHADGSTTMWLNKVGASPDGTLDNIYVSLPPGFVGDPNAVPKCTAEQFAVRPIGCPAASQVGVLQLFMEGSITGQNMQNSRYMDLSPVFNLEPRRGNAAELGVAYVSGQAGSQGAGVTTVRIVAKPRTNGDFGVTAFTGQIPAALPVYSQAITLWGTPWEPANDIWRAPDGFMANEELPGDDPCHEQVGHPSGSGGARLPLNGLVPSCQEPYDPQWGPIKPFLSNETDCNQRPAVELAIDAFQNPGKFTSEGDPVADDPGWKRYLSPQPAVVGCESLGFNPDIAFSPTTAAADGASGLQVDLSIPQQTLPRDGAGNVLQTPAPGAGSAAAANYADAATAYWESPAGRATAHLKDTVVTLPAGVSVNPSAATGLQACGDGQVGLRQLGNPPLFNNGDPFNKDGGADGAECPDGSKLGTARVRTPLLEQDLTGEVVLGEPKSTDPQSGEMFRTFLVLRNVERGLVAKIYGTATADPGTGQITARFLNNPELPFDRLWLDFKSGSKGLFGMPQRCGSPGWAAAFTPWSAVGAATPVADRTDGGGFGVSQNCANAFAPGMNAAMDTQAARANGTFTFQFGRPEGQQYLRGLTAQLPKGLLASVKDVPLCSNAAAGAGACPAGSKIGLVDAKAGSGDPFVLEQKGEVFLTEGYKGGEYGLAVKIRPVAGPFRGGMELSPVIVRQALHVDRRTAQVTAISDPFPLIHHGIPLRVREVTVLINRGRFMLNPSDCAAKQVGATLTSDQGAAAGVASRFQASGCANLPFKPKLKLRLTGRKQVKTGKHPGIRATVTQKGIPEAGIDKAEVRLPKTLALDVENAQALCEYEDGTKPDLERHCPKGSIVGRARAVSPLLNRPLVGNVYFVKNVRRSSTGNLIRTLPMIIVALRGEISVNLVGESDAKRGKLVNTFEEVPDAPISRFNLNIKGGKNGIIAVTRTRRGLINLCTRGRQVAEADMDGHNGRRHDFDVNMRKPCARRAKVVCRTKKQKAGRACKAKAKRLAAKRRAAKRRNARG